MQSDFSLLDQTVNDLLTTISLPRLSKYLSHCKNVHRDALFLYHWNTRLSQALYYPLQAFEIAFRNSVSGFLKGRYGPDWPYTSQVARMLASGEMIKLQDAIDRQKLQRKLLQPATDTVVADLTLGFWTNFFTRRYEVPLTLNNPKTMKMLFPCLPPTKTWRDVAGDLEDLRDLRNRVAHHEPVFHLDLELQFETLQDVTEWLCPATRWLIDTQGKFLDVLNDKP